MMCPWARLKSWQRESLTLSFPSSSFAMLIRPKHWHQGNPFRVTGVEYGSLGHPLPQVRRRILKQVESLLLDVLPQDYTKQFNSCQRTAKPTYSTRDFLVCLVEKAVGQWKRKKIRRCCNGTLRGSKTCPGKTEENAFFCARSIPTRLALSLARRTFILPNNSYFFFLFGKKRKYGSPSSTLLSLL